MNTQEDSIILTAAADALAAGRAIVGHLGSSLLNPIGHAAGIDLEDLARRLDGPAALDESTREDVRVLYSAVEEEVAAGTVFRTEWMPKSCCGDDVTEWEPWTRPVRSPDADRLLVVARDLRRFAECSIRVAELIAAANALDRVLRRKGK